MAIGMLLGRENGENRIPRNLITTSGRPKWFFTEDTEPNRTDQIFTEPKWYRTEPK